MDVGVTETIRNEMRGRREPLEEFSFKTQGHAIETVKADDCQSELSIFLSGLPVEEKQHYRKENWKLAEQGKEKNGVTIQTKDIAACCDQV